MQSAAVVTSELEPWDLMAIVLSVFVPGMGHVLLGQKTKGLLILAMVIASCGVGYVVSVLVAADCYCIARVRKERLIGEWEVFPEHHRVFGI